MGQNLPNQTRPRFKAMNVIATFENDPRKYTDVIGLAVIFSVRS